MKLAFEKERQKVKQMFCSPTKPQILELVAAVAGGLLCSILCIMGHPWLASMVPMAMLIRPYRYSKNILWPIVWVGAALAAVMMLEPVVDAYYTTWFFPLYKALGLGVLLSLAITPHFMAWLKRQGRQAERARQDNSRPKFPAFYFFVAMLVPLLCAWASKGPYLDSFDLAYELEMLRGETPLNDVHTMAHTFLLWLCAGNPVVLVGLQIFALALLLTVFAAWFYRQGMGLFCIGATFSMFSLCGTVTELAVSPIKDLPAALCMGVVLYYSMRLLVNDLQWHWGHRLAFGSALAFTGLLRHNGYVLVLAAGVWLLFRAMRQKQLFAVLASGVVCIVLVNAIGYGILHAQSPNNGFSVQVYATGIVAVERRGGDITEAQRQRMKELLPMDYVEACLSNPETEGRTLAQRLCWIRDLGQYLPSEEEQAFAPLLQDENGTNDVFNNLFILAAGEHKTEIITLYFELFLQNPWLCTTEIIRNTTTIWRLERGLALFSHVFYLIGILAAFVGIGKKKMLRFWPVLLPIGCNVASVVVAASTNELRYLLPTFLLAAPAVLFFGLQSSQPTSSEEQPQ